MTKARKQALFERYASEPVTTTRRYTVPLETVKAIRNVTPAYGSQGRAIQVGTEILVRRKVKLRVTVPEKLTRMTYKLLPRTIEVIDELTGLYGSHAAVFAAVDKVLQEV